MPTTLYVSRAFHQLLLHCPKPQLYFSSSLDDYHHMPSTGLFHTVLLKSDGTAVAFGDNGCGQCNIPALPEGVTYTQAATGDVHTVLLKSDGNISAFGGNGSGQCTILSLIHI